jgi:hypothetical protein
MWTKALLAAVLLAPAAFAQEFTLEQVRSYPFPQNLTAAASAPRIAWTFNERGLRNVYVAEAPDFRARKLTNYTRDDGPATSSLAARRFTG